MVRVVDCGAVSLVLVAMLFAGCVSQVEETHGMQVPAMPAEGTAALRLAGVVYDKDPARNEVIAEQFQSKITWETKAGIDRYGGSDDVIVVRDPRFGSFGQWIDGCGAVGLLAADNPPSRTLRPALGGSPFGPPHALWLPFQGITVTPGMTLEDAGAGFEVLEADQATVTVRVRPGPEANWGYTSAAVRPDKSFDARLQYDQGAVPERIEIIDGETWQRHGPALAAGVCQDPIAPEPVPMGPDGPAQLPVSTSPTLAELLDHLRGPLGPRALAAFEERHDDAQVRSVGYERPQALAGETLDVAEWTITFGTPTSRDIMAVSCRVDASARVVGASTADCRADAGGEASEPAVREPVMADAAERARAWAGMTGAPPVGFVLDWSHQEAQMTVLFGGECSGPVAAPYCPIAFTTSWVGDGLSAGTVPVPGQRW